MEINRQCIAIVVLIIICVGLLFFWTCEPASWVAGAVYSAPARSSRQIAALVEWCKNPALPAVSASIYPLKTALFQRAPGDAVRLACRTGNDIVCNTVRGEQGWETDVLYAIQHALRVMTKRSGKAPIFLDMGGNVGSLCVPVAAEGYETHVFEMLPTNLQLLNISRCANHIAPTTMRLHHAGLSDAPGECDMISGRDNEGDAILECPAGRKPTAYYVLRGKVAMRLFDSYFEELDLQRKLDEGRPVIVKIDIEGSELRAMRGATRLLAHRNKPRLIFSEAWKVIDCTAYAELMFSHGYIFFSYAIKSWVTTTAEAAVWHKRMPAIDNIAWVHPDFAVDFSRTPGQPVTIPPPPPRNA